MYILFSTIQVVIGPGPLGLGNGSNGSATIPLDAPATAQGSNLQQGGAPPLFKSVSSPTITNVPPGGYLPGQCNHILMLC